MFGWPSDPAIRDSETKRRAQEGSAAWNAESSLRATRLPRSDCSARYTTAIPPRPRTPWISKRPTLRVPVSTRFAVWPPDRTEASLDGLCAEAVGRLNLDSGPAERHDSSPLEVAEDAIDRRPRRPGQLRERLLRKRDGAVVEVGEIG